MNSVKDRKGDRFDQMDIPVEQEVYLWENNQNVHVGEIEMLDHKGIWTQWERERKIYTWRCLKWISTTKKVVDTGKKTCKLEGQWQSSSWSQT